MTDEPLHFVHDTAFVEAFSNTQHRVLGRRLDPFCLWHQFNLEVAQSKLLLDLPFTLFDLWTAVEICTSPWTPSHQIPRIRKVSKLRFLWMMRRYKLQEETLKFSAYLVDYSTRPKFWKNNHETKFGNERDFDENLELALHLVKQGFSWREVWTLPLGMLHWNSVGLSKLAGAKVDIWTPEHQRMFDAHVKQREARLDAEAMSVAQSKGIPFDQARADVTKQYWEKVNNGYAQQRAQPR